jgi:hypothetical protein
MPVDPDQPDIVREALLGADSLDSRGIRVEADDDVIVLRGSVASHEEATAAAMIAERHADVVRNEISVDRNLREVTDMAQDQPVAEPNREAAGSSFGGVSEPDDLVTDMQESLTENVPWDPPHEAVQVPTRAEARGLVDRSPGDEAGDDILDGAADAGAKSLPDLSPEELARAAHPQPRDEETNS